MEPINRRSYFRIDDQLGINYQILDEQEYQQHQQEHRIARLEDHQQRVLEQKLSSAIRSVEIRYPDIGEILSLLNQKLNSWITLPINIQSLKVATKPQEPSILAPVVSPFFKKLLLAGIHH